MKVEFAVPVFDAAPAQRPNADAAEQRELIQAVQAINHSQLFGEGQELTFQQDPDSKRPVIRIVDRKTREVVSQIPGEQALRIAGQLKLLTHHDAA